MIDFDATAAALTTAMPVLAATVWPVLIVTVGVSLWWLTLPTEPDDFNVDDYKPEPRQVRPAEAHTQPVPYAAWTTTPTYTAVADRLLTRQVSA